MMKTTIIYSRGTHAQSWSLRDPDGNELSCIMIDADGMVLWVGTPPKHRRRGYARMLWEHLIAEGVNPKHSECRMPDGDKWAHAVGGYVPPLDMESLYC